MRRVTNLEKLRSAAGEAVDRAATACFWTVIVATTKAVRRLPPPQATPDKAGRHDATTARCAARTTRLLRSDSALNVNSHIPTVNSDKIIYIIISLNERQMYYIFNFIHHLW